MNSTYNTDKQLLVFFLLLIDICNSDKNESKERKVMCASTGSDNASGAVCQILPDLDATEPGLTDRSRDKIDLVIPTNLKDYLWDLDTVQFWSVPPCSLHAIIFYFLAFLGSPAAVAVMIAVAVIIIVLLFVVLKRVDPFQCPWVQFTYKALVVLILSHSSRGC